MPQTPTIALVDIGCLFKRTFEVNPNAGAANSLAEIVRIEERVSHLVLCVDSPPYKRKQIFPGYKANRVEPETSEIYQKKLLYKQLKGRGYPIASVEGEEADDVIATLARIYGESWPEVWLVGADKDLAQCVTSNVLQLVPKHGERAECFRGPAEVREKFEVTPEQIPLFLALVGDKSDNVPGVPGVGPVKAAGLIAEHKTLTGIAEHLHAGSGKVWEALRNNWEQLVLSLRLTTLDSQLPIDADALLTRAKPQVAEAPKVELELVSNATPMPEQPKAGLSAEDIDRALGQSLASQIAAEHAKLNVLMEKTPEPIIGKDPRAEEFLRQEAAARAERERQRNADRAAEEAHEREQQREADWREQKRREMAAAAEVISQAPAGYVAPVPPPMPAPAERATVALMPPVKAKLKGLALLRAPFEKRLISKLPKGTKEQNNCPPNEKRNCNVCGGWHHPKIIHLDYVGHAALTDRLLDADPEWSWKPVATAGNGLPLFDANGGLWIELTVCGVTRLGYGNAAPKNGQDPGAREKEVIGDALRNAAMRFGAALELWHKGAELHGEDWDASMSWEALVGS